MIGALVLATALVGAPPADPGVRIGEAAATAQALQGPLDGRWTLRDAKGQTLYAIELADPAGGRRPLAGAWRDARSDEADALIIRRSGERLTIIIQSRGVEVRRVRLRRAAPGRWTGTTDTGSGPRRVALVRD